MNVAIICTKGFGTDGISAFITNNYKFFSDNTIHYHLIFPRYIGERELAEQVVRDFYREGTHVVCISKDKLLFRFALELHAYLRTHHIDVVHINGSSSGIILEALISKVAGVRTVITHSHNSRGNHQIIHKMLKPALAKVSDVHLACGILAGQWMYGSENYTIIPNGIDTERYLFQGQQRCRLRRALSITDGEILIGHVGGFNEVKNQAFLVRLLYCFFSKGRRDIKLLLVGRGSMMSDVKIEAERLGVVKNVIFTGQRNDIPQLMMAMDIFCLPSLYEGFPIVAVEAQAAGLPLLVSSTVSQEISLTSLVKFLPIDHGEELWEEAVLDVVKDKTDRAKYARIVEQAGYDIRKSASELEAIYKK